MKSVRTRMWWGPATVCLLLLGGSLSYAGMTTVYVTGQVTYSGFGTIPVPSGFTGQYTYDDTAPYTLEETWTLGHFWAVRPAQDFTLRFVDGSTIYAPNVQLILDDGAPGGDGYMVGISTLPMTGTGSFAGATSLSAPFELVDPTGNALNSSYAIPAPDDLLSLFAYNYGSVSAEWPSPPSAFDLELHVTGLSDEPPAVPVPAALGLGIFGLAYAGWRLRRQQSA